MSLTTDDYFFEKQNGSETWTKFSKNKTDSNYTQVSVSIDSNGFPVVVLRKIDNSIYLKLTENMLYEGNQITNISFESTQGLWKKTNSK